MTITTKTTVHELLAAFFAAQADGVKGVRHQRMIRVERHLHECAETEGHRILVTGDLMRLEAERIFDPAEPFARMAVATDLIFVLSIFVGAEWLMADPIDRRMQLTLTDKLTGFARSPACRSRRLLLSTARHPMRNRWCAVGPSQGKVDAEGTTVELNVSRPPPKREAW